MQTFVKVPPHHCPDSGVFSEEPGDRGWSIMTQTALVDAPWPAWQDDVESVSQKLAWTWPAMLLGLVSRPPNWWWHDAPAGLENKHIQGAGGTVVPIDESEHSKCNSLDMLVRHGILPCLASCPRTCCQCQLLLDHRPVEQFGLHLLQYRR